MPDRLRSHRFLPMIAWLSLTAAVLAAAPPLVVETAPLSPDEQRQQFRLPPGFAIELIASEPEIGQPMNLNFDAAGRLWVTHSVEYPYPVAGEHVEPRDDRFGPLGQPPAKDRVSILSGLGTEKVEITHVADGLNIPIGIVPLSTSSAVAYSIPDISLWTMKDAPSEFGTQLSTLDAHPLYGPFGNVDTHGMVNGLTHWIDGWVYACHGFRNTSTVEGADGHVVAMNSGNTFRFQPDGSHVERYTWGQVNPFGLTFDPWGNIYTADCHSKPLTCLIPGAYYPSFGKPDDGLGFGPNMIDHSHGSTGICGPCFYAADQFPPDYRDNLFLCNPVTGIVHRDKLAWHGSTPRVDTQPEFITCSDGWFRPVDIQLGPDGALYIADFYNSIIGHYEVPLEDPRRDRTHGRIWRVTYTGDDAGHDPAMPDLTTESLGQLIERLDDPNLTVRILASHQIVSRHGREAAEPLQEVCRSAVADQQRIHALWILTRIGADVHAAMGNMADVDSAFVQTHLARVLGNQPQWTDDDAVDAAALLRHDDARVRRAAAEAISVHPREGMVDLLMQALPSEGDPDTHLRHAIRIALRNCLQSPGALKARIDKHTPSADIASVCMAIRSDEAAAYLLNHLRLQPDAPQRLTGIEHIARYGSSANVGALAALLRDRPNVSLADQVATLEAFDAGQSLTSAGRHHESLAWATDIARQLLEQIPQQPDAWQSLPLPTSQRPPVAWGFETRKATDGKPTQLWSSLPGGEPGVGVTRSPSFEMPARLTFWLAGHDGFPKNEAVGKNFARLVRDDDGTVLQTWPAPRQDAPVAVTWDAGDQLGTSVHIELIDGLDLTAYAWIAAGRFSIDRLALPENLPSTLAARLIGTLQLSSLQPELKQRIADPQLSATAVGDLATALLTLKPNIRLEALQPWLAAAPRSSMGQRIREQLVDPDPEQCHQVLIDAMRTASSDQQQAIAEVLAGHANGATVLVGLVEAGHASARLLQSASVMQKLLAVSDEGQLARIEELTADLPPEDSGLTELIQQRRTKFGDASTSTERGREVFKKTCAACHQIGDEGKKVGPQLDGIGIRGLDRLLEDTLDPNRNVDGAFRSTTILTSDGRVLTGLLRREEGDTLVLADSKGDEFRVRTDDIDQQALSPLSLMPADIAAKLPEDQLHDLLAFLLAQRQSAPELAP